MVDISGREVSLIFYEVDEYHELHLIVLSFPSRRSSGLVLYLAGVFDIF